MLDDLIRQLHDIDPDVRREAIIAIGRTKDAAALRPLADVVRNDPDSDLRELARKAGVYIRKESEAAEQQNKPTGPSLLRERPKKIEPLPETPQSRRRRGPVFMAQEPEDPSSGMLNLNETPVSDKGPVRGRNYNVPKEARSRAREYTEAALSDHMKGKSARAMKNLTEALSLDPNLINDEYYNNVAANVTGLNAFEAVQLVVDKGRRDEFMESATVEEKRKKIDSHLDTVGETTRTDFYFELVIFCIIMVVGPIVAALIAMQGFNGFLNVVVQSMTERGMEPEQIAIASDIQSQFAGYNLLSLIPFGVGSLIVALLSLFIQMGLVHLLATRLLGGHGTFQHLLTVLLKYYNRWLPIVFVAVCVSLVVTFFSQFSPIAVCPTIVMVGIILYVTGKTSSKIGEAYGFGGAMGCMALLVSSLVLIILNGAITYMAFQATGAALQSLFSLPGLPGLSGLSLPS